MKWFLKRLYTQFGGGVCLLFLLASCDFSTIMEPTYNDPVRAYFEKYTDNAVIEKYDLDGSYPQNSSGITCLTSSQSHIVKFYIRNP